MMSGAYSQFSKMDSDEVYAAAIQDLQEIFSLKVTYQSRHSSSGTVSSILYDVTVWVG